nr:hypothetical protein [Tanacetum cinerariifolium]
DQFIYSGTSGYRQALRLNVARYVFGVFVQVGLDFTQQLGKSILALYQALCEFGSPSPPFILLETCGISLFLGHGSSGGGERSLPTGFEAWGRLMTSWEAWLEEKRCTWATVI